MDPHDELEIWKQLHDAHDLLAAVEESEQAELALQKRLRAEYPNALVRAALELRDLRRLARAKFSGAEHMWFDRTGLEQATSEDVARHKARRFSGRIWDLCCGIGGDAIALASAGTVTAVDASPLACLFTDWNAEVYDVTDSLETRCAAAESVSGGDALVHVDPDRRTGTGTRTPRIEETSPPLEALREIIGRFRGGAIKLSPAANFFGKFPDAEIELVSLRGECKEATVWFGELSGNEPVRATVLPAGATLAADPLALRVPAGPFGNYLYDPDPAVVRAGLIDVLADSIGCRRLDEAEEYLTSDEYLDTPFGRAFEILAVTPNNPRDFRKAIARAGFGQIEIKCRHVRVDVEKVRRKLPLDGIAPGVLIFARVAGRTRAIVCRRVD